jgi:hypothetical protein
LFGDAINKVIVFDIGFYKERMLYREKEARDYYQRTSPDYPGEVRQVT